MTALAQPKTSRFFNAPAAFRKDPIGLVMGLRKQYGDFVVIPMPFNLLTTNIIYHPDLIHEVLVTHADQFEKPAILKRVFRSSFGNGLFFSEGTFWKRQRRLMQPAFHHVRIHAYGDDMVRYAQRMVEQWHDNEIRRLDREMRALTLTIIVNALFKTDVSGQTEQVGKAMESLGQAIVEQATSLLKAMIPDWVPTAFNRQKQSGVAAINNIIYDMIAKRRATGLDTGDLLSVLLQAKDEETGETMSDLQVRDELMTLFIAGHETTATTLAWAWVEIARHPEVEARLRAELGRVLGGRPPHLDDLPNLPYTAAVIKEALRMYPAAWLLFRQSRANLEIGGTIIRKNSIFWISPYAVHRDSRWFDQPDEFIPERFLEEKPLHKFAYFPFGGGSRICIGSGLAMMEAQLVLATVAQQFSFELTSPVEMLAGGTLAFKAPVRVRLKKTK